MVKAAYGSTREILNPTLSFLTFVGTLVEFLILRGFSTLVFFSITAISLFDIVAGYILSIIAVRRDMDVMRRFGMTILKLCRDCIFHMRLWPLQV